MEQNIQRSWSVKDLKELLAFYDFPAEHWVHIRTTNPIESTFAMVRLRSKNCGSRETTLAMRYKLMQSAQKKWRKIKGFNLLSLVVNNVPFKDGEIVNVNHPPLLIQSIHNLTLTLYLNPRNQ